MRAASLRPDRLAPPWAPTVTAAAVLVISLVGVSVWHSRRLGMVDAWALRELGAHSYRDFQLASAISAGVRPLAIVASLAIVAFAWRSLPRRDGIVLALASPAVALAAEKLLKPVVARQPPESDVFLYPSGHLAVTTALALTATLVARSAGLRPRTRAAVASAGGALVLVLARARLADFAHSLSDVVGGVATGVAVTLTVALLLDARPAPSHPGPKGHPSRR
jgi:membrane-associated phospholipid phosphatase